MAKALLAVLVALTLINSAIGACDDGYFEPSDTIRAAFSLDDSIDCVQCSPLCRTCDEDGACDDLWDSVEGAEIDSNGDIQGVCGDNSVYGMVSLTYTSAAYNKEDDNCSRCMEGCNQCVYDYDICTSCMVGWDYNRGGRACLRASLGLAAVNMILSIVLVVAGVLTCLKASKLS